MDWNLKAPSWDLSELEQATLPSLETVGGSSRFGVHRSKGEFSVDLKLGQVGNSGTDSVANWKDHFGVSKVASTPSSGSSKRARAINNGTQMVSCLVDGCNSDLSNCRDYHRRHKVCEIHSKTPEVTINGHKQRFCQQCSRFHSLEEFDEGKRSCRKRLDGHNRRRRKPQPEPPMRSGSFLSNYQGAQLLPFSSSHVFPSTAVVNPSWSGVVTSCTDAARLQSQSQHQQVHLVDKQELFLGSSPTASSYKEGKQLAFLQGDNPRVNNQNPPLAAAASVCQTLLRSSPLSESNGIGSGVRSKMLCDSVTSSVQDPHCALSLLSSPHTHTTGNGLNQMVQQPLGLSLHDNNLDSVDQVLVSNATDTSVHCPPMYGSQGQGSETPHPFPFHWE
ncbi:hypothetical protein L6164_014878 [Bauhinia variegata]|uniref:Uncharacterized protein n=1 Tax=Bauhinia variegata TaxID=167791 RepID=A0ACB9NIX5_BAUVA|nr:hypothetical protein L6164_014878 [Bauhinia variegata]